MSEQTTEQLLAGFERFLEQTEAPSENDSETRTEPSSVDLFTLFAELAVLKNEVHLEGRQFNKALQQFSAVVGELKRERSALTEQLAAQQALAKKERREMLRPLLVELLELRDRIEAGSQIAQQYQPKRFTLSGSRHQNELIGAMGEGQSLTLRRLDQLLAGREVRPIDVLNQPLDPYTMRAAETDHQPDYDNGVVTAELRRGFLWGDDVLRLAEVKVNKV